MGLHTCDFPNCDAEVAFWIVDQDGDVVGYECEPHAIEHVETCPDLHLRDAPSEDSALGD